jgi:hypothetical protein
MWQQGPIEHVHKKQLRTFLGPGSSKGRENAQQQGKYSGGPHGCWWLSSRQEAAASSSQIANFTSNGQCSG